MTVAGRKKIVLTKEKEYEERKKRVCSQLEALKKQTQKGNISKLISVKLKKELEDEIAKIENELVEKLREESEKIENELKIMQKNISELESKQNKIANQKEELEARFRIKRIDRKQFNNQKNIFEQQIKQIVLEIELHNKRIERLGLRLKYVTNTIENKIA